MSLFHMIALRLFEAMLISALLNNCASWIGINKIYSKNLLKIFKPIPKAYLEYDAKLLPLEWRIEEKKLNSVRQIL